MRVFLYTYLLRDALPINTGINRFLVTRLQTGKREKKVFSDFQQRQEIFR